MDIDFSQLRQLIFDHFPQFHLHRGNLSLKGDTNWSRNLHRVFPFLCNKNSLFKQSVEEALETVKALQYLESKEGNAKLIKEISDGLQQAKRDRLRGIHFIPDVHSPIDDIKITQNASKLSESFIWNPKTEKILSMDWSGIQFRLEQLFPDKQDRLNYISAHLMVRSPTFEPFPELDKLGEGSRDIVIDDGDIIGFNLWTPPKWYETWEYSPRNELDPLFQDYLNHMFPIEEHRTAVLGWLRDAIFDRAKTALCLQGIQGCGKSLFGGVLCKEMVGEDGWDSAEERFYNTDFTKGKELNQILFVDEKGIPDGDARVRINRYLEDALKTEGKGQNLNRKASKLHSSLVITSNEWSKWYAIPGERRFFYPDLGESEYPRGPELAEHMKTIKFQQQLANYLKTNFKLGDSYIFPKKTATFQRVLEGSQPGYVVAVVDLLLAGQDVSKRTAHKLAGNPKPRFKTYKAKLKEIRKDLGIDFYEIAEGSNESDWTFESKYNSEENL